MEKTLASDRIIDDLIAATLGENAGMRQTHILRESLRGLVRLAKVEQVMEIKTGVDTLTEAIDAHAARRRAKAILLAQRLPGLLNQMQQTFEFKH